jgi:alpha-1,2-mannosyltransferase
LLNGVALNLVVHGLTDRLLNHGILTRKSLDSNFHTSLRFIKCLQGWDSWLPMWRASEFFRAHPGAPVYQSVFFDMGIKFQYPLLSILPVYWLQDWGITFPQFLAVTRILSWLAVWLVAAAGVLIAARLLPSNIASGARKAALSAVLIAGICFHPLLRGYTLGQVQILLALGFAIAFYCWLRGREKSAGALIGILALIKPQFVLLLIWAALRKRWGALAAGLATAAVGFLISVVVFGWHNNLDYLSVLSKLSHTGEAYEMNQSMNGLLNRLLFNGQNLIPESAIASALPSYNPIVYAGTVLSTIALVGIPLFFPWKERRGGMADFSCMAVVATVASPVAWEHHYSIFLPIFVWLWFSQFAGRSRGYQTALLALAYILISDCLSLFNLLATKPVLNMLQSYTYFGGLIVICLLLVTKSEVPGSRSVAA